MLKRTLFLLASVTLVMSLQAQDKRDLAKKAPVKIEPATETVASVPVTGGTPTWGPTALNWVAVDTMQNTLGPAIGALNPLAFDPWTNTVLLTHRGRSTYGSSGRIYYNYSTDAGATWTRVATPYNASNSAWNGRYPSGTFNNPTQSSNIQDAIVAGSWPELVNSAFGGTGAGADEYAGSGFVVSAIYTDPNLLFSSQVPTFANDNTAGVFWASDNQSDASIKLWKTTDFQAADTLTPPTWGSATWQDGFNVTMGGAANNGTVYYAVIGTFETQTPISGSAVPGYSKSTDNGATWSAWKIADFRNIPALARYDRLYDYVKLDGNTVSYQGDMNVDKDGHVHFLITVTDTTVDNQSGENALVEVFETANGWDGKVVFHGIGDSSYTKLKGPGIGQTGPAAYFATDKDKNVFAAIWNMPTSVTDSLCDIYASYRTPNGDWSTPVNLTQTPGMNENSEHAAPYLKSNGNGSYSAFVFYHYPAGYTGYYPNDFDPGTTQPSVIYGGTYTFTVTGVENEVSGPTGFALSQNFPNPFNPTTSIKFNVGERANVTLKVYDMLGREVATLVNEVKESGSYDVNFDAAKLSSGTYVYKLTAGNFVETKKMVLLK